MTHDNQDWGRNVYNISTDTTTMTLGIFEEKKLVIENQPRSFLLDT